MREFAIFGWVDSVDAVSKECDGFCTGIQRPLVRRRVDALREPTDNTKTGLSQVPGEIVSVPDAARGRVAAADDRQCREM